MANEETLTSQQQDGESPTPQAETEPSSATEDSRPSGSQPSDVPEDPEARAEYFRSKFANSSKEAQRLAQERSQWEQQQQNLYWQNQQLQQQLNQIQQERQQRQQPQFGQQGWGQQQQQPNVQGQEGQAAEDFLTPEEEAQLIKAQDNMDSAEVTKLLKVGMKRARDQGVQVAQQQFTQTLSNLVQQQQQQQATQQIASQLAQEPEMKDAQASMQILNQARQAQMDPMRQHKYGGTRINLGQFGEVSPYALEDALKDYRLQRAQQNQQARAQSAAANADYADTGGTGGPDEAMPGTSSFNAATHLTATERSAIKKATQSKGTQYSGMDYSDAYKAFWKQKPEGERKQRLQRGSAGGHEARKSWTSRRR